jgi:peroxidase
VFVGLRKAKMFSDLVEIPREIREKLEKIYESVDDIDAFTGGLSEQPFEDALIGPTFSCLFLLHF